MKKSISLVLALVLALSLVTPALAAEYSDVPATHYARSAISNCAVSGIVSGYEDGTFRPTANVTNAQFMVMLARAFYPDELAKWTAKSSNEWWWPGWYALWNVHAEHENFHNITAMKSIANDGISRYDMAFLMNGILTANGKVVPEAEKDGVTAAIKDWSGIPEVYRGAVSSCYALEILGGMGDGTFSGDKTMNRAQGCVVIDRLADQLGGSFVEVPVPEEPSAEIPAETPTTDPSALTLRDGSAVTEENVTRILNIIMAQFPAGTTWNENTTRKSSMTIEGRELGALSQPMRNLYNKPSHINGQDYATTGSVGGCSGFAGMVSDAIFGGYANGGNDFPIRKTTLAQARPGDVYCKMIDGKIAHVGIIVENHGFAKVSNGRDLYEVVIYGGNVSDKVAYSTTTMSETPHPNTGYYNEVWTRYPD